MLIPGDPVPTFFARSLNNPRYAFSSVAGRYVVVSMIASTRVPGVAAFLERLRAAPAPFDDRFASLFVVTADPGDAAHRRVADRLPGIRVLLDEDFTVATVFGARFGADDDPRLRLGSWVLDTGLRVLDFIPWRAEVDHLRAICESLAGQVAPAEETDLWAPVLRIPHVFEPEFCRELMVYCDRTGTEDSGFMRTDPATGQTVAAYDHGHKRRRDCMIEDETLRAAVQARIHRRIVPAIEKAFQFRATRMERYLIACYDGAEDGAGGHFRPRQDNTTLGTAHRRFAVSINLNAEDYEGGDLRFPEYGPRVYRPPTGGAVVFSCSLLHEATPVSRGTRYVVLPFLYDDAAAELRLRNAQHLADEELRRNVVASVTGE